ncbi:MAG: hypothetical protein ACOY0R_00440 [Chloroflexota bacterium]
MNRKWIWIALLVFLLPIVARAAWFYPGTYSRAEKVQIPDYNAMQLPLAPLQTPQAADVDSQMEGVVVFDMTHANLFQQGEVQALTEALTARGGQVEFDMEYEMLAARLRYASAYVIVAPNSTYTGEEIRLLADFVARGGRLAVFTDATRGTLFYDYNTGNPTQASDSNAVNPLLAPFGITINNDYLYNLAENEGNFRNVYFDQFGQADLTGDLKRVALYGTHSVKTETGTLLLSGGEKTFSSLTDAHNTLEGGAALSADGNVLVFGDATFLSTPYNQVADNSTLIGNIADFLLGGARQPALVDFPFLFRGKTVQVLPTAEVQMTAEMVAALGQMQANLSYLSVDLKMVEEAPDEGDMLILGTFVQSDDLDPFIKDFDLVTDDYSSFVEVPGIGKVGRTGNGLVLFLPGEKGNTLILLAETTDDLTYLLSTLNYGGLSSCLVQGEVALCSIGFGGSFSEDPYVPYEEPVEEATPTPAG